MTDRYLNRILLRVIVERSLLDVGEPTIDILENTLRETYGCTLEDCYDHPQYLKDALCELFGRAYAQILSSIKKEFAKVTLDKKLESLLLILDR